MQIGPSSRRQHRASSDFVIGNLPEMTSFWRMSEYAFRLLAWKVTWRSPGVGVTNPSIPTFLSAVSTTRSQSAGSFMRNILLFILEVVVSLKSTPLSTQKWTCWELATCICVLSWCHSPFMADLSVRYFLRSYIFIRVCLNMTSRCHDGEAWQNIAFKVNFRLS